MELAKNSWELARLKALKEEEERRAEWEEDEMLFTYSREDSYNQVKKSSKSRKSQGGAKSTGSTPTTQTRPSRANSRKSLDSSGAPNTPVEQNVIKVGKVPQASPVNVKVQNPVDSSPAVVQKKVIAPLNIHVATSKPSNSPLRSPNHTLTSPKGRLVSPPNSRVASPSNVLSPKPKVLSPKENSNPNTPQPWSNPNLVIRTRRASKQEAILKQEERFRHDSESSEVDILTLPADAVGSNSSMTSSRESSRCASPMYINPAPSKQAPVTVDNCKLLPNLRPLSQDSNGLSPLANTVDHDGC